VAYDLTAMRAEVVARGFDYLSNARIDRFLNDAMHMIDDLEPWVYLRNGAAGVSPVSIAGLGRVESVTDTTNGYALSFMPQAQILAEFGSLTLTGARPLFYYVRSTVSDYQVTAFPVSSVSLSVSYFAFNTDLSSGSDTPGMPDRFRYAIVEYAVAAACRDVSNYAEAQAASAAGDAVVARMREWNLLQQGAPNSQVIYGDAGDW
jgi:hypothetical protein